MALIPSGRFNSSGFKWMVVNRDANAGDPNGRITGGVHSLQQGFQYGNADNCVQFTMNDQSVTAGGFWQHLSKTVGWSVTNAGWIDNELATRVYSIDQSTPLDDFVGDALIAEAEVPPRLVERRVEDRILDDGLSHWSFEANMPREIITRRFDTVP